MHRHRFSNSYQFQTYSLLKTPRPTSHEIKYLFPLPVREKKKKKGRKSTKFAGKLIPRGNAIETWARY